VETGRRSDGGDETERLMASLTNRPSQDAPSQPSAGDTAQPPARDRLDRLQRLLADGIPSRAQPILERARARADAIHAGGGNGTDALRPAATSLAADTLIELAIEGWLQPIEAETIVSSLADACSIDREAARFDLYMVAATTPGLVELPPAAAAGVQLGLLVDLGVAAGVSLWRNDSDGRLEQLLHAGEPAASARMRAEATVALRERRFRVFRRAAYRSAVIRRFGHAHAAVVARTDTRAPERLDAYLVEAAAALSPVLDREHLLERSAERERALVSTAERRLMRLGFDLHDGPIQDVLALGAEVQHLRDQANPYVAESHRDQVFGRFDDVLSRLVELDRQLREIAHSLESKSIVSRPVGEILHREVDAFTERSGVEAGLELLGDPESLTSAQRVAVFRAIQEGLSNVREHSGATRADIVVRARRSSIEVRIVDNGTGFEVERAIAQAAERGRLGLVGIGERVRMLGGTFEIESEPGGPTVLAFSLPRWEPLTPSSER
jgi:signal transduction histidine kinase